MVCRRTTAYSATPDGLMNPLLPPHVLPDGTAVPPTTTVVGLPSVFKFPVTGKGVTYHARAAAGTIRLAVRTVKMAVPGATRVPPTAKDLARVPSSTNYSPKTARPVGRLVIVRQLVVERLLVSKESAINPTAARTMRLRV